jgi:DNA-binding NarL/FixJ family response regulator
MVAAFIGRMAVHALPAHDLAAEQPASRTVALLSVVPREESRILPLLRAAGSVITQVVSSDAELEGDAAVLVIVCDDSFPARRVRELVQRFADSRVLVVSSSSTNSAVRRAVDAGAVGFVPLEKAADALVPSLDAVVTGQLAIPVASRQELLPPMLTTREKQVLHLVVTGLRNGEIAAKLFLAESTVKSHLSSAFSKLGVRSRNEAVAVILDVESQAGRRILTLPADDGRVVA